MKIRFLAILLPLLGACATYGLTPQQEVYALQRQLDVALEEIEVYAAQPPCAPETGVVVACYDPRTLEVLVTSAGDADLALDQAEAVVVAGGTTQDVLLYVNIARAALARVAAELAREQAK